MLRKKYTEEQIIAVLREEENRRLKQIVGEQALDIRALKELLSKNF